MLDRKITRAVAVMLVLAVLGACSRGPTPEQKAAARKAAMEKQAQQALVTYHRMLARKNYQMAAPLGEEIVTKYPGTRAAAEVKPKLKGLLQKADAQEKKQRLERLWVYQVAPMDGGTQSTASIDASRPPGVGVRMVLRRHTAWGLSVFLYADGTPGFMCHRICTVPATFDDRKVDLKAYVPKGGRPALMIRGEKAFIADLEKASIVHLKVRMKATGLRDLKFEVGGFDASKWKPLKK
jgi:hypothetical protein